MVLVVNELSWGWRREPRIRVHVKDNVFIFFKHWLINLLVHFMSRVGLNQGSALSRTQGVLKDRCVHFHSSHSLKKNT